MRLVLTFWGLALFFGLVTEGMDVLFDGKSFSLLSATIKGLLFSALMTGFFFWKDRRETEEETSR